MADLRKLLEDVGYEDVRTHQQSGNVVLSSPLTPRKLEAQLERQLAAGLGMEVQVLVRTRAELAKVVALDPLGEVATSSSRYLVSFLAKNRRPQSYASSRQPVSSSTGASSMPGTRTAFSARHSRSSSTTSSSASSRPRATGTRSRSCSSCSMTRFAACARGG